MTTQIVDKFGLTYEVSSVSLGSGLMVYHVERDGVPVERAVLNTSRGCIKDVVVYSTDDRRRGIATALYDAIERLHGFRLLPNHMRLADGKAFWRSRQGTARSALGRMAPRYAD